MGIRDVCGDVMRCINGLTRAEAVGVVGEGDDSARAFHLHESAAFPRQGVAVVGGGIAQSVVSDAR